MTACLQTLYTFVWGSDGKVSGLLPNDKDSAILLIYPSLWSFRNFLLFSLLSHPELYTLTSEILLCRLYNSISIMMLVSSPFLYIWWRRCYHFEDGSEHLALESRRQLNHVRESNKPRGYSPQWATSHPQLRSNIIHFHTMRIYIPIYEINF